MDTLSIVMPSYNPGNYFRSAIESALSQMSPLDELVIQDAGSTDGSQAYLAGVAAEDSRVKVVVEKDNGQSDALNRVLARAVNDWIIWLNADDILVSGSLAAVRRAISTDDDLQLVVGAHQIIRADGSIVDSFPGHRLDTEFMIRKGCSAFSGSIAMRRNYLIDIGGFETTLHTVMDLSLQLRMAQTAPRQVVIVDPIGALRFHEMSKTANLWSQFVKESHQVRRQYAVGRRGQLNVWSTTALHVISGPIFRIRLTPGYRRLRRLTRRSGTSAG